MKSITCDICGKTIHYYNYENVFKMRIKIPTVIDIENPKYHLCENCYGDMVKFMDGIKNELKREVNNNE